MLRPLLRLLLIAGVAVAAPVPLAKPKEPSLVGKWITTERSHNGAEVKGEWVWVIDGERFTAHSAQNGGVGTPCFPDAATLTRPAPTRPVPSMGDEYDYTYRSTPPPWFTAGG